jgi:hypothetical protein
MLKAPRTCEPQYEVFLDTEPMTLGPMASYQWRHVPERLLFVHARYGFVAKMLAGKASVAEIGCGDGSFSPIVAKVVGELALYDIDPAWTGYSSMRVHDIVAVPLPALFDAVYMIDVFEHIAPDDESRMMDNIVHSLTSDGVFIAGSPTLESQAYASDISRAGHVNCKKGAQFRSDALRYFENVFLFGMNDATLHTGYPAMSHYHFILCTHPKS